LADFAGTYSFTFLVRFLDVSRPYIPLQQLFLRLLPRPFPQLAIRSRFSLALWSRLFDWRDALVIVKPATLIRWHRKSFKLFWRLKSRAGRPRLPKNIQKLIVQMVSENAAWEQALQQTATASIF
jgi:hypothetical protein